MSTFSIIVHCSVEQQGRCLDLLMVSVLLVIVTNHRDISFSRVKFSWCLHVCSSFKLLLSPCL